MANHSVLAGLREVPCFSMVPLEDLERLAATAVKKTYPKNVVLINEGDEGEVLFVLLKGKVQVFLSHESGRTVTLSTQGSGEIFGEIALLDGEPRSASVITLEPTACLLIPRLAFRAWLREHPESALRIISNLTYRIRVLTERVRELALLDVYSRLVKALQGMAVADETTWIIEPKPSHRELASLIGCSREMVSRIMKDLARGGYIAVEGKRLRINRKLPEAW
jgi:CRP/FNR family cyclic AMP-dependent transcriptional regulator